jgi:hypothetical protein
MSGADDGKLSPATRVGGPLIGDCLHNAASALDQLAYRKQSRVLGEPSEAAGHWTQVT